MTDHPDHTIRAHSSLGASVAHRWMACPGSIRLSAGIDSPETVYAAEGTAAHELAEKSLRWKSKTVSAFIGDKIVVGNHIFEVDEEMAEAVQLYFDTVMDEVEEDDLLMIEVRFDLTSVYAGMFGTCDAVVYKRKTKKLLVFDLKYGKGHAVEAADNPQLAYYGVGAVKHPELAGLPIDEVELVIVQPRAPHRDGPVRRWSTDALHLIDFMADLREAAVATTAPDAPLAAGQWCKFCPAAGVCPALRDKALSEAQAEFAEAPAELSDEDLAGILEKADLIGGWIKAVFAEAFNRAQAGQVVPGWKLVSKRAVREWRGDDGDLAIDMALELGVDEDQLFAPRKLKSPAQLEGILPKADRSLLDQWVVKESSGTTLARDTDRRAAVQATRSAADDFDPVE